MSESGQAHSDVGPGKKVMTMQGARDLVGSLPPRTKFTQSQLIHANGYVIQQSSGMMCHAVEAYTQAGRVKRIKDTVVNGRHVKQYVVLKQLQSPVVPVRRVANKGPMPSKARGPVAPEISTNGGSETMQKVTLLLNERKAEIEQELKEIDRMLQGL